ncbi:helix-turn-helix domain-containing protein [Xanthomonas campestris pv. incanae]|uniref:helix-turn-helix transcriptional regulator n=1 Tax=Xanthomonas campestris TaxID=339 RepID=UPI0010D477FE|nr:helix-turn-helix domain-containing protein [Xanthomonas campestris]MDX6081142.1 helix-turn-helix domain-containing protein [Xanthomonas campestris pv. incanae]MDX6085820.1 helix-turn-helix domain-containing protein [Xanthomonas campestris pv. incanae]MDX6139025.1 helix-turn-helix domain-containing protein [Xanthomonas campestris pv. incanae]RZA28238.1 MAG: DNA-binding protein [Pseudomonadota bacterium]
MTTENSALPTSRLKCPAAAAFLGLTASTLEKMRHEGRGPRYVKIGGRVFYRQSDLDAYLEASVVETTESRARAG